MAAASANVPEQGRPPEAVPVSRIFETHPKNNTAIVAYDTDDVSFPPYNNNNNGNDNEVVTDLNCNLERGRRLQTTCKETLRKVFFKRPVRKVEEVITTVSGAVDGGARLKARSSFHQDVHEALNSLLWQPYEYQKQKSVGGGGGSLSSSSSCSSLCSSGLESSNNGAAERCGNAEDLHLMVNNLRVNRLSQSARAADSRDVTERRSETYLPLAVSPYERCNGVGSRRVYCDEFLGAATMRVEVQPPVSNAGTEVSTGGQNVNLMHQSRTMLPQVRNASNLSSVNVVGLPRQSRTPLVPNHSRNTSEPFRGNNGQVLTPSHPRNASEPATTPYRPPTSISNANIVSILNHQRYTGSNPVNHLRGPYQQAQQQNSNNVAHQRNGSDARASRVPLNVSNVNVNYYRAVPVNVVSAVPTIQCLNTTNDHVSNVNIVQAMPAHNPVPTTTTYLTSTTTTCSEVVVHTTQDAVQVVPTPARPTRTFTSTEAQTDDTTPVEAAPTTTREQRRRERRERRHQRRLNNANHRHADQTTQANATQTERLPDLLNNTLPPPYASVGSQAVPSPPPPMVQPPPPVVPGNIMVPPGAHIVQSMVPNSIVPSGLLPQGAAAAIVPFHHPQVVPGQVPLVQSAGPVPVPVPSPTGFRFPFPAGGFRRSRYSEEPPKSCCGLLAWRPGSLRWFIALIALVAVCCVLVGTALGAMRPSGRDHLTVSLLMIGVGIILVTVSGVAWRLTSHDSSTCRSMLGLGSTESVEVCPRRFVPRLPPSYGRPHHPYAAMMYPEFQYRPPPPSYQASMQEYRLRLLLLDRGNTPQIQAGIQNAVSPPPTYRSHSGSLLRAPLSNRRDLSQSEYSCPPSYRSQTSSSRPATMMQNPSIIHSREQSLSLSESNNGGSVVNVVNILTTNDEDITLDNITLDSLKLEPDNEINPLKMLLKGSSGDLEGSKDGNLVTIVQTSDQSPVIVTVSGSSHAENCNTVQITEIPSEMEILAHL